MAADCLSKLLFFQVCDRKQLGMQRDNPRWAKPWSLSQAVPSKEIAETFLFAERLRT
jgi:hypothetical protein